MPPGQRLFFEVAPLGDFGFALGAGEADFGKHIQECLKRLGKRRTSMSRDQSSPLICGLPIEWPW